MKRLIKEILFKNTWTRNGLRSSFAHLEVEKYIVSCQLNWMQEKIIFIKVGFSLYALTFVWYRVHRYTFNIPILHAWTIMLHGSMYPENQLKYITQWNPANVWNVCICYIVLDMFIGSLPVLFLWWQQIFKKMYSIYQFVLKSVL